MPSDDQRRGPVGVLALQGDVREHHAALSDLGVHSRPVRRPADLAGLAGIILPGGESTTLSMLLDSSGLAAPLTRALHAGLPAFGTCAGLVLLATTVLDGRADQHSFGVLDAVVRRNGFGRQLDSFETTVVLDPGADDDEAGKPDLPAVFIRAPKVESIGPGVRVVAQLATDAGPPTPVALRQGPVLATTFHPELTGDRRLHARFVAMVAEAVHSAPGALGALR